MANSFTPLPLLEIEKNQWVSLALPLARLLLSTFLPFAVLILLRKPCSFFL